MLMPLFADAIFAAAMRHSAKDTALLTFDGAARYLFSRHA